MRIMRMGEYRDISFETPAIAAVDLVVFTVLVRQCLYFDI